MHTEHELLCCLASLFGPSLRATLCHEVGVTYGWNHTVFPHPCMVVVVVMSIFMSMFTIIIVIIVIVPVITPVFAVIRRRWSAPTGGG